MTFRKIRQALKSPDEEIRRSALLLLRDFSCRETEELYFSAMADESWRVRKEAVGCYILANPDIDSIRELLILLRNEDNAGLRNSAAEAVTRYGAAAAAPLMEMVLDPDADVRKMIIDIMGSIGDPVFVPALSQALYDPEVNVAAAAAEHLGSLGDAAAIDCLLQAILEREDVLFRFSALTALGTLAEPMRVPEALAKLSEQDILRKTVFECLGKISDESTYKLLLDGFSCPQKNSRAAAVKALYKVYGRSLSATQAEIREALQLLKENEIITGLLELFGSGEAELTEALLWTAVVTSDARFIPRIIEAYHDERTADVALLALKSFGRDALLEVVRQYPDLDEKGRSGLCDLISECGYPGFNDLIQGALHDSSALVRKSAAKAVGKLGLLTLLPDLIQLVDDSSTQVYTAAVAGLHSLVMISRATILENVRHFSSSKAPHHRIAAAQLLAALGEREQLLLLVKDEEPQVRRAAVAAIAASRIETSVSMLVLALVDEDPDVRIAAANALGEFSDPAAIVALEHALNDEDVWVQSAVLTAIAKIEPTRALTIIKNLHFKALGLLLITCLKTLETIGGSEAEEIIRHELENSDQDIARQAARSLDRLRLINSNQVVHALFNN